MTLCFLRIFRIWPADSPNRLLSCVVGTFLVQFSAATLRSRSNASSAIVCNPLEIFARCSAVFGTPFKLNVHLRAVTQAQPSFTRL